MSGSKHSTWKDAKRALEVEEKAIDNFMEASKKTNTIYRELYSKHYIKKKTIHLRKVRREAKELIKLPNDKFYNYDVMPMERSYNIEKDNFEGVFYPINEADINAIINKLPSSITFNLKIIRITMDTREKKRFFLEYDELLTSLLFVLRELKKQGLMEYSYI